MSKITTKTNWLKASNRTSSNKKEIVFRALTFSKTKFAQVPKPSHKNPSQLPQTNQKSNRRRN
jgi:hypothetical protein